MKYALPYGTFLALGALAASLAGDRILAWYLSFMYGRRDPSLRTVRSRTKMRKPFKAVSTRLSSISVDK